MFIKNENGLVFIKSKYINVFPCGRRRAFVDSDGDNKTTKDQYYIPFDPEARLNTESNNRKHSGLNGFRQSYIYEWNRSAGTLALVINGYLFNIELKSDSFDYSDPAALGAALEVASYLNEADSIYANIKLADNIELFSGNEKVPKAVTEILRDQVLNNESASCLDFLIEGKDKELADSYYFSGLSLSAEDRTSSAANVVSLQILTKKDNSWQVFNQSKLPSVSHGEADGSIEVGSLSVNDSITAPVVNATQLMQNDHAVSLLDVVAITNADGNKTYRLKFSGATASVE
jgi:hypothetical protein